MKKYTIESNRIHFANENTFFSSFSKPYTLYWKLYLIETKELIGSFDVRSETKDFKECEIGYTIGEAYQNNGYATECIDQVIHFMHKTFSTSTFNAKYFESNKASARVLEKNHFQIVTQRNGLVRAQRKKI